MAQPHKGDRVSVTVRLPRPLHTKSKAFASTQHLDLNAYVSQAVREKVARDAQEDLDQ